MLEGMNGGVPQHTTIDFIQGVAHDNLGMMASGPGIDKVWSIADTVPNAYVYPAALQI